MIRTICVFCGSGTGAKPVYRVEAEKMARYFTAHAIHLVYGGANVGLMGIIADTMISEGGKVTGVMPQGLVDREVAHKGLEKLHIVKGMQERKALMAELSDAFIALPGGYGTLDELFEMLSWHQLQIIQKPIGILNIDGYFDPLVEMLKRSVEDKFLRPEHYAILQVDDQIDRLMVKLTNHQPVVAGKWIEGLKRGDI